MSLIFFWPLRFEDHCIRQTHPREGFPKLLPSTDRSVVRASYDHTANIIRVCWPLAALPVTTCVHECLLSEKLEHRRRMKLHARLKCGRWEIGLIWRIRKMLRLQAESLMFLIGRAAFSTNTTVKKIAAVKLHAGLGRPDFKNPPAFWLANSRSERQRNTLARVQGKVLIVAVAIG